MTKTRSFLLAAGIALAMVFTLSCSGDDGGGGGSGLAGTSWELKEKSGSNFEFTYTITFKSAKEMSHNRSGWGMVGKEKRNYNETTNGTYEYYPEIKEGVIYCSVFTGGMLVFAISGDSQTMSSKTGSTKYTRK